MEVNRNRQNKTLLLLQILPKTVKLNMIPQRASNMKRIDICSFSMKVALYKSPLGNFGRRAWSQLCSTLLLQTMSLCLRQYSRQSLYGNKKPNSITLSLFLHINVILHLYELMLLQYLRPSRLWPFPAFSHFRSLKSRNVPLQKIQSHLGTSFVSVIATLWFGPLCT